MRNSIFLLFVLISSIHAFGQDHYEKKYSLGQNSGGKWYKLMNIDLNGNGNHNSVNITVDFHYVNTWTKYNSNAVLRLRENSNSDWQSYVTGIDQSVLKFKKISNNVYELWGFSNSGWGHLSFTSKVTKEAPFIMTIPDLPVESSNIDALEDVIAKGNWYFPNGRIQIEQSDNPNSDNGLIITEKNNSQKIALHLADNSSGEYGYLSLGGDTQLRGNGKTSSFDGNVGIGTKTPQTKLDVVGTIKSNKLLLADPNDTSDWNTLWESGFYQSYNAANVPEPNQWFWGINMNHSSNNPNYKYNGQIVVKNNSVHPKMYFRSTNKEGTGTWARVVHSVGNQYIEGALGIGTTNPDAKLAVNGNIHTKEVKVDLNGWADYVFKEDYDLPSLQQVEDHIATKGHLINIPSAAEVEENGIQLGEMNAKLLEKIEELTLYTIAQEKAIKEQEKRNNSLETKNKELEERLEKLEKIITKK